MKNHSKGKTLIKENTIVVNAEILKCKSMEAFRYKHLQYIILFAHRQNP